MSRNLCRTNCEFCGGEIALLEAFRPITEAEAGQYYQEYRSLFVCNAYCRDCEARYLAWKNYILDPVSSKQSNPVDLSFRSTFNDEPGEADLPEWEFQRTKRPWPKCVNCGLKIHGPYGCRCTQPP